MNFDREMFTDKLSRYCEQLLIDKRELHEATGISLHRIEQLLDKQSDPTGDEVLIFADYFKCDFRFFISNERLASFEQTDIMFRRDGKSLTKSDRRAIQDVLFLCENEEFLMDELGYVRKEFVFKSDDTYYKRKSKKAALLLRDFLGYTSREIASDVYHDCRVLGVHVFRRHLDNSNISGLCIKHPVAGMCILINYSEDVYRQRFSVSHELAHAILDNEEGGSISFKEGGDSLKEVGANYFASNYLMPPELLGVIPKYAVFTPEFVVDLSSKLMVNIEPLLYALSDNDYITQDQVDYLKSLKLKQAIKQDPELSPKVSLKGRERKSRLLRKGLSSFYVDLCIEAFEKGVISKQRMAEVLMVSMYELQDIFTLYGKRLDV